MWNKFNCLATRKRRLTAAYVLCSALLLTLIYATSLSARLEHHKNAHRVETSIEAYDSAKFRRMRPYLDLLAEHYKEEMTSDSVFDSVYERSSCKCVALGCDLDAAVCSYQAAKSDGNFDRITQILDGIRRCDCLAVISDCMKHQAAHLTIATILLAPFPSRFFAGVKYGFSRHSTYQDDPVMLFLGSLRHKTAFYQTMRYDSQSQGIVGWKQRFETQELPAYSNVLSVAGVAHDATNTRSSATAAYLQLLAHCPGLRHGVEDERVSRLVAGKDVNLSASGELLRGHPIDELLGRTRNSFIRVVLPPPDRIFNRMTDAIHAAIKLDSPRTNLMLFTYEQHVDRRFFSIDLLVSIGRVDYELRAVLLEYEGGLFGVLVFDCDMQIWTRIDGMRRLAVSVTFAPYMAREHGTTFIYERRV